MFTGLSGLGVSRRLLVGALMVFSVAGSGAASAVTLVSYQSFSTTYLSLTGARTPDGTPVGIDSVLTKVNNFGIENIVEAFVFDADGIGMPPDGIVSVDISSGSLFDAGYEVLASSEILDAGVDYAFENVSDETLLAALRVDRRAWAEAFSLVSTATSGAWAGNEGAESLFLQTPDGFADAEDRLSDEAVTALRSSLGAVAASGGPTSESESILHDFEILLNPGETFHADFFITRTGGSLTNTPAPVPLPAGAPLLLAALGGLAVARRWRNPAR